MMPDSEELIRQPALSKRAGAGPVALSGVMHGCMGHQANSSIHGRKGQLSQLRMAQVLTGNLCHRWSAANVVDHEGCHAWFGSPDKTVIAWTEGATITVVDGSSAYRKSLP